MKIRPPSSSITLFSQWIKFCCIWFSECVLCRVSVYWNGITLDYANSCNSLRWPFSFQHRNFTSIQNFIFACTNWFICNREKMMNIYCRIVFTSLFFSTWMSFCFVSGAFIQLLIWFIEVDSIWMVWDSFARCFSMHFSSSWKWFLFTFLSRFIFYWLWTPFWDWIIYCDTSLPIDTSFDRVCHKFTPNRHIRRISINYISIDFVLKLNVLILLRAMWNSLSRKRKKKNSIHKIKTIKILIFQSHISS